MVIDPNHDLLARVLDRVPTERRADVVYLDASRGGKDSINLLTLDDDPVRRTAFADAVVSGMTADLPSEMAGPVFLRMVSALVRGLGGTNRTLVDLPLAFHDRDLGDSLVEGGSSPAERRQIAVALAEIWGRPEANRYELASWVAAKLHWFAGAAEATFGATRPTVDGRRLFSDSTILLVHPGEDPGASTLVGSIFLALLMEAARDRNLSSPALMVFIDEAQRMVGRRLRTTMNEARKRAIGLHLATQHLTNLDGEVESVLGNAGTIFAGRVLERTALVLERDFGIDAREARRSRSLSVQARLQRGGALIDPFAVDLLPWWPASTETPAWVAEQTALRACSPRPPAGPAPDQDTDTSSDPTDADSGSTSSAAFRRLSDLVELER